MDLITLEEYKSFNALSDNPKENAKIALLISSVSNLIQAYLGVDFEGGTEHTETLSIDYDTDKIYLSNYPIEDPVTVSELSRYTYDSSIHVPLTGTSEYIVDKNYGTLTRLYTPGGFATWPVGSGTVIVTYNTAPLWSSGEVPADMKLATVQLVNYYKNEEFRQSKTIQGSTIVNTLAQGEDFPKHIQIILDRYRKDYVL